jgi:class 3 adenylate cyclase/tetratricopeptide (TPR) repeat protein
VSAAALLPFVPALAVRRFLAEGASPAAARAESLPGAALLFADISGFTALVERLGAEGKRGAERVQEILNAVFGPLDGAIEAEGGELLRFPGDAALALFAASPGDDGAAPVQRAAAAALEAVRRVDGLRLDAGVELHLRAAVTAGTAWAAAVGGVGGRFELIVRGEPFAQLAGALALARTGEVVVSPEAWKRAGSALGGHARSGALRLEAVAPARAPETLDEGPLPAAEALGAFVPHAVQARLEAGQREFLAEFRRVSVVFVELRGLDAGAGSALERLQATVAGIQETTRRYGGSLNQLVEDDKGTVAVLGFGVALHAHEDDAARAALAALEIRERLVRLGLDPRIGIASDRIFTGLRGSGRRAEHALIGSGVNLAARLMQRAEPILCDGATRAAARRRVWFESLPPVAVKGRREPVSVYRPRAVRADEGPRQTEALIGRVPERQILERRLADLEGGAEGGVVFVEGEPGIGKSRLIRELLDAAQATGVRALVGAAEATEQQTSLLAWRPIVRGLLGAAARGGDALRARLLDALGPEAEPLFPLLGPLLPISLPETEAVRHMTPQGRAEALRSLVRGLLRAATARGPVLLVLEDGHWMDSASWELAETAAREVPGLLLVVCLRPMPERPPPCRRLLDDIATLVVRLDVLGHEETLALVCRRLDVDSVPAEVAALIHRHSEGHPLFSEELAYSLRDTGRLEIQAGECRLVGPADALDGLELSETVSGVVSARIDALTPQQQLTLKVASVLGRHFELDAVRVLHPLAQDHAALEEQLAAMVELGLLRERGAEEPGWDFRHALIREAAYELLPYAQRCELHRATAEWLAARYAGALDSVRPVLGHHYERAERWPEAIEHLSRAGDLAHARWENAEAAHFFGRVLALDDRAGGAGDEERVLRRASWERKQGDALCMLGDHARGVPVLRSALARLGLVLPEGRSAQLRAVAPRFLRLLVVPPRPGRATADEREATRTRETLHALARLGASAYTRGEPLEGMLLLLVALRLGARLGPSAELAQVYMNVGNVAAFGRRLGFARRYAALAVEMAEQAGDRATLGAALCRGQLFEVAVANFDALPSLERGLAILEQVGDHYLWGEGATLVARLRMLRGELEAGLALDLRVLARARQQGTVVRELWALAAIAEVQLRLGRLEDAIASAGAVLAISRTSGSPDPNGPFQAAGVLASAWVRQHGAPPAADVLAAGERALHAGGWVGYTPQAGYLGLMEAHVAHLAAGTGDPAPHEAALARLARPLGRSVFTRPFVRPVQLWLRAERQRLRGRERRAVRALRAAIASAEAFRLPYEAAQLRARLAAWLPAGSAERAALRSAAIAAFESIGAEWDLAAAREIGP